METNERRLIVDRGFDRTIELLIDAFLRAGFTIEPFGAGDLRMCQATGNTLRHAVLEAWLPASVIAPGRRVNIASLPSCEIAVHELVGSCTLVTAAAHGRDCPTFGSLGPSLDQRIGRALRSLTRVESSIVAA
jgi:hypothetical protein